MWTSGEKGEVFGESPGCCDAEVQSPYPSRECGVATCVALAVCTGKAAALIESIATHAVKTFKPAELEKRSFKKWKSTQYDLKLAVAIERDCFQRRNAICICGF